MNRRNRRGPAGSTAAHQGRRTLALTDGGGTVSHERAIEVLKILKRITELLEADPTTGGVSLTDEQADQIINILTRPEPQLPTTGGAAE